VSDTMKRRDEVVGFFGWERRQADMWIVR
jgi:hypothetical protein